jgi:hypothetical protein
MSMLYVLRRTPGRDFIPNSRFFTESSLDRNVVSRLVDLP